MKTNFKHKHRIYCRPLSKQMSKNLRELNYYGQQLPIVKDSQSEKVVFDIADLELIKTSQKKSNTQKDYSGRKEFKAKSISSEINVIGKNVDEACLEIDKYLDNCSLTGLASIRIVHGKGTGALRAGIHKFLKTHPHVQEFRVGTFGEGEMGVTIVTLK